MTTSITDDLHYLTIGQAARLLRERRLSPVELTRAFLERIDKLDGTLTSYITVLHDAAMAEARRSEAEMLVGDYRGPLHGIPIALKDIYDTRGVRTTASSRVLADRVPERDATTTERLRSAGSVLLGKLATHEFALGGPDPTCGGPLAKNPWNIEHIPSGSSSGSGVAVAAGLSMGTMGSCTGGSIRGPAAFCSVVGLKATYGRVSRFGVLPLSWTLDHCGPLTWTVEDTALMLQAVAGYDPNDPTTSRAPVPDYRESLREDVRGLRIGVPRHFFFADDPRIDPDVTSAVDAALAELESLGAEIVEVTLPTLDISQTAQAVIMLAEAFTYHERNLRSRPADYGEMCRTWFRCGALFTAADYVQAQRVGTVMKREFSQVLREVDVIASPTMPTAPARFDESNPLSPARSISFVGAYNMTGMPALSVPCGFNPAGLPIGLQIAGKPFDEPTVLRVGHTYERHARWFERRPPV